MDGTRVREVRSNVVDRARWRRGCSCGERGLDGLGLRLWMVVEELAEADEEDDGMGIGPARVENAGWISDRAWVGGGI